MENSEQKTEELKQKGYSPVWIYDSVPNEDEAEHSHDYETCLVILEGEIEIRMDEKIVVLKIGDEIDIPKSKLHSAKSGPNGCKYIVAEKHG